ncbi:hypothetical protein [Pseudoalteromonas sp.]|uniref:hypothetical protein n=1 Tax=Pseudoalteromonas sp. TaxID=53249 RepID=UPI002630326F|nr:hypothetical protein [Pseudoalteromonas sp.]MCP4585812.1 hypothetical protein [Pseudoalteromonas sp.]
MALTPTERDILDKQLPINQQTGLGTEVYAVQNGQNITLPESDPDVAGRLWNDSGTVKVSTPD